MMPEKRTPHRLSIAVGEAMCACLGSELSKEKARPPAGVPRVRTSGWSANARLSAFGVVRLAGLEHRHEHGQETVRHSSKRTAMTVADRAKPGVLLFAVRVMLHARARPVIEGIAQSHIAAIAHSDLPGFATLPGHGSDPAVSADCMVVPLSEWPGRFCQKRVMSEGR